MTPAANAVLNPRVATAGEFFELLKPRVMSLVIFTAYAGIVVAPGHVGLLTGLTALLSIAVGAGASGALNMAYDADIDSRMSRTASRPIPMGYIARNDALFFGWALAAGSVMVMSMFVNLLAAALLAFSILFYVVVYTLWLKRRTAQNIVIGGLAGALPPAIGWAAVTGSLTLAPFALVFITFLWTPPHFWALALYRSDDYARAGVPMMPVVQGKSSTRRQIFAYALLLFPAGVLPAVMGLGGPFYAVVAVMLGGWLAFAAFAVLREKDEAHEPAARRLFGVSILYLFVLFAALIAEHVLGMAPISAAAIGSWM